MVGELTAVNIPYISIISRTASDHGADFVSGEVRALAYRKSYGNDFQLFRFGDGGVFLSSTAMGIGDD